MCGINVFNHIKSNTTLEKINYHCQKRGPDSTNIVNKYGITFIHNLLSITGQITYQPFIKNNIICLFNGEIYNYNSINIDKKYKTIEYNSDGDCIIDTYLTYGLTFARCFDGEFSILLFDFNDNVAGPECLMITDTFGTKPLFYGLDGDDFMISSYSRCLDENGYQKNQIKKVEANSIHRFKINKLENNHTISYFKTHTLNSFELKNQTVNTYDDWCEAFEQAVEKRVKNLTKPLFIPMSGGYDSGAICCALNNLGIKYKTYTIKGKEDLNIVSSRLKINDSYGNHNKILYMDEGLISIEYERNMRECSDYECKISHSSDVKIYSIFKDRALNGGGYIAKYARKDNNIICLSGQGADEILSDYGYKGEKKTKHSCFGGLFPNDLTKIIDENNTRNAKWLSFQSGINEGLLMKEESIFGSYGIETRYPFLDTQLVQKFLYLTPELKNKWYKAPLHHYLTKNKYPFKANDKIGLNCLY